MRTVDDYKRNIVYPHVKGSIWTPNDTGKGNNTCDGNGNGNGNGKQA